MKRFRPIAFMKGAPTFDPSTRGLSMWWRDFANPTTPIASAGASGSNGNLAPGTAPTFGSLNGHATSIYNGSTQYLASATNASTLFSASAMSGSVLMRSISQPAASGFPYSDPCVLCLSLTAIRFILSYSSSGAQLTVYNAGYQTSTAIAFTNNVWCALQWRWNGINAAEMRVNRGAWSTIAGAVPGPDSMAGTGVMNVGANYNAPSVFANVEIADILGEQVAYANSDFDNDLTYYNSRYAQSL